VRTVAVASSGRKLGKTMLACVLVRELARAGRSVTAVKARPLGSAGVRVLEGPGREGSDTHRFSVAGASAQALVDFASADALLDFIRGLDPAPEVLLVEGGTAAGILAPDLLVYITGGGSGREHAALERTADLVIEAPPCREAVERAVALAAALFPPREGVGEDTG
jgi:hypothetical protein